MATYKGFKMLDKANEELFYEQRKLSKKNGLMQMTTPTPQLLFEETGRNVARRRKMYFTRAGLRSGRYLWEKNLTFRDNYITAITKLMQSLPEPQQVKWKVLIKRIKQLPLEGEIWNILPPLKEWYPQNKLFKGSDLPKVPSYKGEVDVDIFQSVLYDDIDESLELNGV